MLLNSNHWKPLNLNFWIMYPNLKKKHLKFHTIWLSRETGGSPGAKPASPRATSPPTTSRSSNRSKLNRKSSKIKTKSSNVCLLKCLHFLFNYLNYFTNLVHQKVWIRQIKNIHKILSYFGISQSQYELFWPI